MFDAIVLSQSELDNAIKNNAKNICLCDGFFYLPFSQNITYYALGDVKACVAMTHTEVMINNVTFEGFVPEFTKKTAARANSNRSSASSYKYQYEYEYSTSFGSRDSRSSGLVSSYRSSGSVVYVGGYGVNLI